MKKTIMIAVGVVSAGVVAAVAAAALAGHPVPTGPAASSAPPVTSTAPVEVVTLTLDVRGDNDTRVSYTCVDDAGKVSSCTAVGNPLWQKRVTVPVGTTVTLNADGGMLPPWCAITDEADSVPPLDSDHETARCEWVAK